MYDSNSFAELARLPVAKMQDVLLARFVGRDAGAKMGFPPAILTRIATVISEITRNVVQHSGSEGEIIIGHISEGDRTGLRIIVSDHGKGMEQPAKLLEEGKLGTPGSGLTGARKLVDHFHLESTPRQGTAVTMEFWKIKPLPDGEESIEGKTR